MVFHKTIWSIISRKITVVSKSLSFELFLSPFQSKPRYKRHQFLIETNSRYIRFYQYEGDSGFFSLIFQGKFLFLNQNFGCE